VPDPHETHWYEQPDGADLRQGDIFLDLLVYRALDPEVQAREGGEAALPVEELRGNWIILDASCDVEHAADRRAACQHVLLAQVVAANEVSLSAAGPQLNQRLEVIRRGMYGGRFLLSACSLFGIDFPMSYVEYRQHVLAPHFYLIRNIGARRLRMRSPWREALGNWVGGCFSRVGPEDETNVPPFVRALHDAQRLRAIEE
jgi:hypothetical protein